MGRRRVPSARGGRRPLPMDTPSREPRSVGATVRSKIDAATYALELDTSLGLPETGYYSGAGELAVGQRVVAEWQPQLHYWQIQGLGSQVEAEPAVAAKYGTFLKTTDAAPTTQAITGVGFTPSAVILWATAQTADGIQGGVDFTIGFGTATQSVEQRQASDDAVTPSNGGNGQSSAVTGSLRRALIFTGVGAYVSSLDSDGFTLTYPIANDANAYVIHYIALNSEVVTDVDVGAFDDPSSAGSQSITTPGFQPDAVMFLLLGDGGGFGNSMSIGCATGPDAEWTLGWGMDDGEDPSETYRLLRTDRCITNFLGQIGQATAEAEFTQFTATGFDLNWLEVGTSWKVLYIALKGGLWSVNTDTQKTSAGEKAVTGLGHRPDVLFMASANETVHETEPGNAHARASIGAADRSSGDQGSIWLGDTDGVSPTSVDMSLTRAKALQLIDTDAPAGADAEADATLDRDGFTLDWTTADAVARVFAYWTVGQEPPPEITAQESVSHDDLEDVSADDHHAQSHSHDGADGSGTVAHSAATGQTADDHHAEDHASRHESGAADELDGGALAFTPTTSGDWDSTPTTVQAALDELASRVRALEP